MKNNYVIAILILGAIFVASLYFNQFMPDKIATHWDAEGNVNGYTAKPYGILIIPFISAAIFLLFVFLPYLDPMKHNLVKFQQYYEGMTIFFVLFMGYIQALVIAWNMGMRFDMTRFIIPAFSVLFFYIGILLEHSKRNWFIGIRTPWTMSSDEVWDKTHSISSKLFRAAAIVTLLGVFFEDFSMFFFIIPIIVVSVFSVVYSYLEYRKLPAKEKNKHKHHK